MDLHTEQTQEQSANIEVPLTKKSKGRTLWTDAQKAAFEKARLKRMANVENIKKEREIKKAKDILNTYEVPEPEPKPEPKPEPEIVVTKKPARAPKFKKDIPKPKPKSKSKIVYIDETDSSEDEIIVKRKPKPKPKKIVYVSDSSSDDNSLESYTADELRNGRNTNDFFC